VAKQIAGHQGDGVFLLGSDNEAGIFAESHLDPFQGLLIQRYIQGQGRRDLRILVAGGKVAGAMELFRTGGDFRSNYHLNGLAEPVACSRALEAMAVKATQALGLVVAGVDVIVDPQGRHKVLEVNYSPGFKGLEQATGVDIAGKIIDLALNLANGKGHSETMDPTRTALKPNP
jgi:ribosomal protein S6--L-glutamate ligase